MVPFPFSAFFSALGAILSCSSALAFQIVPTFDGSITADPQASAIESAINAADAVYAQLLSTPITVHISFQEGGGLGSSSTAFGTISYSQFYNALKAGSSSANDAVALAHLSIGPNNPVSGNASLNVTTANLRALGLSLGNLPPGAADGTVTLNTGIMNLSRLVRDLTKFDLLSVTEHEIDEVLGLGSALDHVVGGTLTGPVDPEDLFRYGATGQRSYTLNPAALSYFSLDGKARTTQFNQDPTGDFGDWQGPAVFPGVQDAFALAGDDPDLGQPELTALDVIGYRLTPTPEPAAAMLALLGAPLLARGRRKRLRGGRALPTSPH